MLAMVLSGSSEFHRLEVRSWDTPEEALHRLSRWPGADIPAPFHAVESTNRVAKEVERFLASTLMRTDPLSLMDVDPADAHEFVICCGASSSLLDAAGRGLSFVNRETVPVCQTEL